MEPGSFRLSILADRAILERVLDSLIRDTALYSQLNSRQEIGYTANSQYNEPGRSWIYNFEPELSFKEVINYALVSRQWLDILKPYVCSTIYVRSRPPYPIDQQLGGRLTKLLRRKQSAKKTYPWVSNIQPIIAMGGESYVQRICIDDYDTVKPPVLPRLLDGVGFGTRVWENISVCSLSGFFLLFHTKLSDAEVVESTCRYLRATCPSLKDFNISRTHGICGDNAHGRGKAIVALEAKFSALTSQAL
ncbi:hypothetical protein DL89DRAFT_257887 [Linderina pennispora]|uniref:Uncharacterized protein n=1 Tax=Linderina pennispora TaxID=61395 RepID=A0A1Y1W7Y9_9FUNG|nr:uncharacterized protein DL89DRAFT_257887 [Linderina pennispora]ORX69653.1 hypothetical protein DL89DRAFT_257887 [Linderina pennispora]